MRPFFAAAVSLFVFFVAAASGEEGVCEVRYLSADHVYLDAGRLAGLEEGAEVRVVRGGDTIAELIVEYAADHSASCRVVSAVDDLRVGDRARFDETAAPPVERVVPPEAEVRRSRVLTPPSPAAVRAEAPGPRWTGSAALRWERGMETGGTEVRSDVVTLPFRLGARGLRPGWDLRARGSLRRIERAGGADGRPDQAWRNRVLEIAIVRDGPRETWHLAVGRVGVRAAAAAGPFDGAAFDRRVTGGLRLGAFAGWAPGWKEMGFSLDDQVAGVTLELAPAGGDGLRMVMAAVGRYHEKRVSREHVAMITTWRGGPGLTLLQAADVDVNRSWKRDSAAGAVHLTSFALTGRWQANRRLALSAGFDDREPVRTWETRERPDSLFRDAGRRGLRGGVEVRGDGGRRLNLDAGVRRPEKGGDDTRSWSARGWLPAWPVRGVDLDLSARGFTGPILGGWTPSLGVSHRGRTGWALRGAAGVYVYKDRVGEDDRSTAWLSGSVEKDLGRFWTTRVEVRGDRGDGRDLFDLTLETRRRF